MDRQFNQFARSLNSGKDRRFKILGIEKNGDGLKIIIGTGEPPSAQTCFHSGGVKDFDTFTCGGEEHCTGP